jgi:hypothetical protein
MLIFAEGGKLKKTRRKNPEAGERINNKLNLNITPSPGIEQGSQ